MSTIQFRFEVGNDSLGIGVIDHERTFQEAVKTAQRFIEKNNTTAYIFDRMAHKGKPNLFDVSKCIGVAHTNPFIDNCSDCMPFWGVQVRARKTEEHEDIVEMYRRLD